MSHKNCKFPLRAESTFYAALVLHDIERYSMVLHDIEQYSMVLYDIEQYSMVLYDIERVAPGHMSG